MNTFTKNDRTGNFDVLCADGVKAGDIVGVTKKSTGEVVDVRIGRVGKPFTAKFGALEGQQAVICEVARDDDQSPAPGTGAPGTVCSSCNQVIPTNQVEPPPY